MNELVVWDDDFTDPWTATETVVLQHGNLRNGGMWRGWVPYLARDYRVLRPDLPGHGRSPDPGLDYALTADGFIAGALRMLDDRRIDRIHYVAEGVGAALGVAFAVAHPERIATLTLISLPLRMTERVRSHALGYESWEDAVTTLGTRAWWIAAHSAAGSHIGEPEIDDYVADEVGRVPSHVAVATARLARSWNVAELLPKVEAPVLSIRSEHAETLDGMAEDDVASLVADGRRYLVPGTRSFLFTYINPERVAPTVRKFIREH